MDDGPPHIHNFYIFPGDQLGIGWLHLSERLCYSHHLDDKQKRQFQCFCVECIDMRSKWAREEQWRS